MPNEPTRAIYVRMPDRLARKLDKAAETLGVTKRDVVAMLVNDHLDTVDVGSELIADLPGGDADASEVLDLEDAARLLRAETEEVRALIETGGLPARRLGDSWRLSRTAVLAWLREGDEPTVG